jgi:hypothetical protein
LDRRRFPDDLSGEAMRSANEAERRHLVRRECDRVDADEGVQADVSAPTTATNDSQSAGRRTPTLLWQLTNGADPTVECLALRLQSGRTLVDVSGHREQPFSGIFDDVSAAVRWAFALERSLIAHGWSKSV